ncbi:MAG: hypothetical protein Q4C66_04205 [Lachnospiraceae bacterium]|nr:hypothetical protein [Lachnospiraceae bacterium]
MNMNSFWGKSRILNSIKAEKGAERLMEKISNGSLAMDVLPNSYAKFSGELEEKDYISYCDFLKSANGKKVIHMLEEEDAGKCVEL